MKRRSRTFSEAISVTRALVPGALVCNWKAWEGVELPLPACIGQLAWECRLESGRGAVDLQAGLGETPHARTLLRTHLHAEHPWSPGWGPALGVLDRWVQGGLGRSVPSVFLEVDMPQPGSEPQPLLFPRLEVADPRSWLLLAASLLTDLSAGQLCPGHVVTLCRVVDHLPRGGASLYAAWMGARGTPIVRWIGRVPREDLPRWLHGLGWTGDHELLTHHLDLLQPWSSHVCVGVDVGEDGIGETVGVELYWPPDPSGRSTRMAQTLDVMATLVDIAPGKLDALHRWASGEASPPEVEAALQLKLGMDASGCRAKAYLGFWTPS